MTEQSLTRSQSFNQRKGHMVMMDGTHVLSHARLSDDDPYHLRLCQPLSHGRPGFLPALRVRLDQIRNFGGGGGAHTTLSTAPVPGPVWSPKAHPSRFLTTFCSKKARRPKARGTTVRGNIVCSISPNGSATQERPRMAPKSSQ